MIVISVNLIGTGLKQPDHFYAYEIFKDLWLQILHGKLDRVKLQDKKLHKIRDVFQNYLVERNLPINEY